jgi:hypothetical protein
MNQNLDFLVFCEDEIVDLEMGKFKEINQEMVAVKVAAVV